MRKIEGFAVRRPVFRMRKTGVEHRTMAATPLLREGTPLGVIFVNRGPEPNPFSAKQIALLETFANQAVIAIENVRLFTELQEKNRALTAAHAQVTEALEQQTATSEILRVIGSSPTDAQPVFETIAGSGVSVCAALGCVVFVVDGDMLRVAATTASDPSESSGFATTTRSRSAPRSTRHKPSAAVASFIWRISSTIRTPPGATSNTHGLRATEPG